MEGVSIFHKWLYLNYLETFSGAAIMRLVRGVAFEQRRVWHPRAGVVGENPHLKEGSDNGTENIYTYR